MITPIIMEESSKRVEEKLDQLRGRQIERVHIDIGDGLFSELLTITPADLQEFDLSQFKIDFHLMVDDPVEWIEECVALSPKRLIAQIEHMGLQNTFLDAVEGYGVEAGLALEMKTPISALDKESLLKCKTILLLAIPTGTTGSPFDERVLAKIATLRKIYRGSILIDGGINSQTYHKVLEAGASEVGANSAWWKGEWGE